MYRLDRPNVDSTTTYTNAVAAISSPSLRSLYSEASSTVEKCCDRFDSMALSHQFNTVRSTDYAVPELTDVDMMANLYDRQFNRSARTRAAKNSIRNAASNSICPYCGDGVVAEIDHYLPKSIFAGTTIHTSNLVPSCRDCNYEKRAYRPSIHTPAVLHPYYDSLLDFKWLIATLALNGNGKPIINFHIDASTLSKEYEDRLKAHMKVFKLNERYGIKAAQLLNEFEMMIRSKIGEATSLQDARSHLTFSMARYDLGTRINSWESATYKSMLENDWYLTDYLGLV